jgi:hypothetical protein
MYKPVEMLFTSGIEGYLTPIRFRVQVEDELMVVPVKVPIINEENKVPGTPFIEYTAKFVVNNQLRPGKLRYDIRCHTWEVYL